MMMLVVWLRPSVARVSDSASIDERVLDCPQLENDLSLHFGAQSGPLRPAGMRSHGTIKMSMLATQTPL
jgi:hypothetical protein